MYLRDESLLQRVYSYIQRAFNFLWGDPKSSIENKDFESRLRQEARLRGLSFEAATLDYVKAIEFRAAALLQHISLMIALTGVYFLSAGGATALRVLLTVEIIGYLWAALCCLRCLLQVSTRQWAGYSDEAFRSVYELEGMKRELIYRHAFQVLVILTVGLVGIVVAHLLFSALF